MIDVDLRSLAMNLSEETDDNISLACLFRLSNRIRMGNSSGEYLLNFLTFFHQCQTGLLRSFKHDIKLQTFLFAFFKAL